MVNAENIPEVLKSRDCWLLWRYECRGCSTVFDEGTEECPNCEEEISKVPVAADGGYWASTTDSDTWCSFEHAREAHERGEYDTEGLGFVFDSEDTIAGFDLDDVRDPESEEMEDWARDVLERLDSYTEVSPSGTGYHVYVLGFHPGEKNKAPQESTLDRFEGSELELYDESRYFTVTGDRVDELPPGVEQRNETTKELYEEYMADDVDENDQNGQQTPTRDLDLSDRELIEKAKNADNGDKFERLWNGSTTGYPSHSEAQMAFANLLAFWTGGDESRMLDLYEQSGMKRDEDDVRKFTNYDAPKAVNSSTDFYDPDNAARKATDGGETATETVDAPSPTGPGEQWTLEPPSVIRAALDDPYGRLQLPEDPDKSPPTIHDLRDPEAATYLWEVMQKTDEDHVISLNTGEIRGYEDGVWDVDGEQYLRERGSKALGPTYSTGVLEQLKDRVRAERPAHVRELGAPEGTVAVENGLLDLEEREVRELKPEHYATRRLPVEYDPEAECPRWEQFIEDTIPPRWHSAVQEFVGYCLCIGQLPIHRVLMCVGSGANGKSVFLDTVQTLLGEDNVGNSSLQKLSREENVRADLFGKIANIDNDLSSRSLDVGMFKKTSAGDKIRARQLYQEGFEYKATFKQLYAANQVPEVSVDEMDDAFFRRWLIVEFPNHFPKGSDKRDPHLPQKLRDELPGILNWALDGRDRLLEQQYFTNERAQDTRQRWNSWGDSITQFIEDHCQTGGENRISASAAWEKYAEWCQEEMDQAPEPQQTLTSNLKGETGVTYKSSLRTPQGHTSGFEGLDVTYAGSGTQQGGLDKLEDPREVIYRIIEKRQTDEEAAHIGFILEDAASQGFGEDHARNALQNLLDASRVMEETTDHYRAI